MTPLSYVTYILSIGVILAVPLGLAVLTHRSRKASWRYFGFGALVFLAVQIVLRTPALRILRPFERPETVLVWFAILALTAAVFEEVGRYLGYRYLIRTGLSWQVAVMYGIGHAFAEALLVAGRMAHTVYLFTQYDLMGVSQVRFSQGNLADIEAAQRAWLPIVGAVERLAMLPVHIALSLMVMQAVTRGRWGWLRAAIGAHFAVNLGISLVMSRVGLIYGEALALLLAVIAAVTILHLRPRADQVADTRITTLR